MQNNNNMPPQLIFPRHLIDEGREMIRKSHFRKPYKVVKFWQDNPNISDIASRMSKYGLMKVIEIARNEEIKKRLFCSNIFTIQRFLSNGFVRTVFKS